MLLEVHRAQLLVDSHLHICIHLHTCIPVPKLPKTPTPETAETESFQTTSRGMTDIQLSSTRCNGGLGFTFNHPLCSHGECRLRAVISYLIHRIILSPRPGPHRPSRRPPFCPSMVVQRMPGPLLPTSLLWDQGRRGATFLYSWGRGEGWERTADAIPETQQFLMITSPLAACKVSVCYAPSLLLSTTDS